jgi:hypothetical protein
MVLVVKMATVFDGVPPKSSVLLCVFFLSEKGLDAKDIRKDVFLLYIGRCLSRQAVRNWAEKHGIRFADDEKFETEVRKWLKQLSKDFYSADFDALVKR